MYTEGQVYVVDFLINFSGKNPNKMHTKPHKQ